MTQPAPSPVDLLVPLSLLQPSTTNPRKRIDTAALAALGESIAEHEVMQPILARPHPAPVANGPTLEIVAGERRWRACGLLGPRNPHMLPGVVEGVGAIPCLVRELTDAQVLAMQLVENIARVDLHPLEEAEHYQRMRQDPKAPATVTDIAHLAKVSESRVYERLSLLHLVPEAREAFLAEKLSLKTALLVARMPAAQQPDIVRHLADWAGEPMAPKAAARFIRETFMLRLAGAPFDPADAALVPEAGACGECPKRSGANPQLFADISEDDTCTDRACYEGKRAAQRARLLEEMRSTGYAVLEGDAARALCTPDGRDLKPGLVAVAGKVPPYLGDASLAVAEVLERAKVPPADVQAIAHPLTQTITLAVHQGRLEDALRRLKAHREQLSVGAGQPSKPASPAPAPKPPTVPPAPPGVAASAAQAAQTLAAPSVWAFPTGEVERPAPALRDLWPAPGTPADELMQKVLQVELIPQWFSNPRNADLARARLLKEVRAKMTAALAGAAVTGDARRVSRHALVRMLLLHLHYIGCSVSHEQACELAGVPYELPQTCKPGGAYTYQGEWLWALPLEQAERLLVVMICGDETSEDTVAAHFAPTVLAELAVDTSQLDARAEAHVAEVCRLGALEHGKPAKQAKPKKAKAS